MCLQLNLAAPHIIPTSQVFTKWEANTFTARRLYFHGNYFTLVRQLSNRDTDTCVLFYLCDTQGCTSYLFTQNYVTHLL